MAMPRPTKIRDLQRLTLSAWTTLVPHRHIIFLRLPLIHVIPVVATYSRKTNHFSSHYCTHTAFLQVHPHIQTRALRDGDVRMHIETSDDWIPNVSSISYSPPLSLVRIQSCTAYSQWTGKARFLQKSSGQVDRLSSELVYGGGDGGGGRISDFCITCPNGPPAPESLVVAYYLPGRMAFSHLGVCVMIINRLSIPWGIHHVVIVIVRYV